MLMVSILCQEYVCVCVCPRSSHSSKDPVGKVVMEVSMEGPLVSPKGDTCVHICWEGGFRLVQGDTDKQRSAMNNRAIHRISTILLTPSYE